MTMPTMYQLDMYKRYAIGAVVFFLLLILLGNIFSFFFTKKVYVNRDAYIIKDGFPIFVSEKDYINFISKYPYNPGVQLQLYKVTGNETLWSIKRAYGISIDTLISANPHLTNFELKANQTIVIPSKNGALFAFDDYRDVSRMYSLIGIKCKILGDYKPKIFKIFSPDDIRLVFFENARPQVVNNNIEKIYRYKMTFADPVNTGFISSSFGERVNPTVGEGYEFHNGVDIATSHGTPIMSVRAGIVFSAEWREGFGNTIVVQHYDGYTTFYAHCSKMYVKMGQWVKQGEIIGAVGATGRTTGNHLHYSVYRHGQLLNPIKYLW